MAWDATTEESTSTVDEPSASQERGLALAILWSRDEPWRVGEVLVIAPGDRRVFLFGRGDEPPEDQRHHRLRLIRQRPGQNAITPALASPKVSRAQLRIQRLDARSLAIENLGRRALLHRGKEVSQLVLRVAPGSDAPPEIRRDGLEGPFDPARAPIIQVANELVLLLVERPLVLPPLVHASPAPLPGFGARCGLGLVGESPALWSLREQLALAAQQDAPTLVHGVGGPDMMEVALAACRAGRPERGLSRLDLAQVPPSDQRLALWGPTGVLSPGEPAKTLLLEGLDALAPALALELARVLTERRVPADGASAPFLGRVVATAARPTLLPAPLLGAFHHLVRAAPLDERREDIPFLALTLLGSLLDADSRLRAAAQREGKDAPALSAALVEAMVSAPLDAGSPILRAMLARSIALSPGRELVPPPELTTLFSAFAREHAEAITPATSQGGQGTSIAPGEVSKAGVDRAPLPADLPEGVARGLTELTKSERVVLQHLACNKTSREIGKALFVSVRTVQNHRARICEKLGLRGNNALLGVALRLREHLGPPPSV